ncbi:MAG: hypothetical protein ABL997_18450, partial [Planctomycetota bacterium]
MARHLTAVQARACAATLALLATAATSAAQDPAAKISPPPALDAQEPEPQGVAEEREWVGGLPWWRWSRATGDLADRRRWLEENGIEVGGGLTMDWGAPWHGGVRNRDTVFA